MLAPSFWLYGILGVAVACGLVGSYVKGRSDGKAVIIAKQAREDQVRLETLQIAQLAAAEEIAKITVTHTTIRQKAEVITREVPIYTECRNDPVVSGLLDSARANRAPAEPVGGGELPGVGASSSSNVR